MKGGSLLKWILHVAQCSIGTYNVALCYKGPNFVLKKYLDSDFVSDMDKSKSTKGYTFTLA